MGSKRLLRRPLTIREILAWASAHREATGNWPTKSSGRILGTLFETWSAVDTALRVGLRGLPGGCTLPQLLAEKHNVRNPQDLPPLSEEQILKWADAHHGRTGSWPTSNTGPISGTAGEKWSSIDNALKSGFRSLPGGSSLPQLLATSRGVRNRKQLPPLTEEQILAWADAFHARTGAWPSLKAGPILDAAGETWLAVDKALRCGRRGMAGGSSLGLLLAERRGRRNMWSLPNLSVEQVLSWADAFHERTGSWPGDKSGPITEAPGETWSAVNHALIRGSRGLPGGYSLAELLALERGARNILSISPLTRKTILAWANGHHRRTGEWPTKQSGPIPESAGDTWLTIDAALRNGSRGLRPGSSLARLLAHYCGKRNHMALPPLSKKKILAWADRHHERTGTWPNKNSGPVVDAPGERWDLIDNALHQGQRGLTGGSSLLLLLVKKRGVRDRLKLPPLSEEQILRWAEQHYARTRSWPNSKSGPLAEAPGETWTAIDIALRRGKRGLGGRSSLAKLLEKSRRCDLLTAANPRH